MKKASRQSSLEDLQSWVSMKSILILLVIFAIFGATFADDPVEGCTATNEEKRSKNPLGPCTCAGQLYVTDDCLEGYYCYDTKGNGCYKVTS